jgi:hypothetical protein
MTMSTINVRRVKLASIDMGDPTVKAKVIAGSGTDVLMLEDTLTGTGEITLWEGINERGDHERISMELGAVKGAAEEYVYHRMIKGL